MPAPNPVLLFSKFLAALLLSLSLVALVGLTAVGVQAYKGHAPIELQRYLATYAVILIPSVVFLTAASVALNVLLRDKYLTYAVSLALAGTLYYLTAQGFHNWLYNPVLYQLWTPSDLWDGGSRLPRILVHRVYSFALSATLVSLTLIFFERKDAKGFKAGRRPNGKGWAVLAAIASTLLVVITGLAIDAGT